MENKKNEVRIEAELNEGELTEEDMEQVAGGKVFSSAQMKRWKKAAGVSEESEK